MYKFIKRFSDIICATIGIIGTTPIWMFAIVGILISDPGNVFYVSTRIGKDNKSFRMFKFRTMRTEKSANEASLRADSNRIFTFGKFMRNLKIDEIPQLLNIFNGSMSVIGPRPVANDQKDLFRVGRWNKAADVPVGLSGPAALYDFIYGDNIIDEGEYMEKVFPTRRELEVTYIEKMSLSYDVKMIVYTLICIGYRTIGKEPNWILKEFIADANESFRRANHDNKR